MINKLRLLFLADSHLGFDYPARPQIHRRRRGLDFMANYLHSLAPALAGQVDLLLHGGDLFYRSRVRPEIIEQALGPLAEIAEDGIPVVIVPGNHERSQIPPHLWTAHPNLFIFRKPDTYRFQCQGLDLALSGFPFARRAGERFETLVQQTGYEQVAADLHLLCLHQSLEGARVGPVGYTFRPGPEVIAGHQIPGRFAAVLSGHIHRGQLLTHDLQGQPLPCPVIYPGSGERTSFAERFESKYYVKLELSIGIEAEPKIEASFVPLPARPMVVLKSKAPSPDFAGWIQWARSALAQLDPESVVRIDLPADMPVEATNPLSAALVRSLAPATMNVTIRQQKSSMEIGR